MEQDRGSLGGYDALGASHLRWFVPPVGEWNVQLYLTREGPDATYSVPTYSRLRVVP